MSSLMNKIDNDIKDAMRAKNADKVSALRMLKSSLKNAIIASKNDQIPESEALAVIQKQIKQRKDSVEQYKKGGREDLVDKEQSEIDVISVYLPQQIGDEDLAKSLKELCDKNQFQSKKDFGKAMRLAQEGLEGKADNKRISAGLNQLLQ